MATLGGARAAKKKLVDQFGGDLRLNGIGIGGDAKNRVIVVNVVYPDDVPEIPEEIDGIPAVLKVIGKIVLQREDQS